jgi:hypothetical protein
MAAAKTCDAMYEMYGMGGVGGDMMSGRFCCCTLVVAVVVVAADGVRVICYYWLLRNRIESSRYFQK